MLLLAADVVGPLSTRKSVDGEISGNAEVLGKRTVALCAAAVTSGIRVRWREHVNTCILDVGSSIINLHIGPHVGQKTIFINGHGMGSGEQVLIHQSKINM